MLPALRAALLFLPGPREGCNLLEPGVVFLLVVSYSCLIFVVWTLLEKVSTSSVMEAPVCVWQAAGLGEFLTCGSFGNEATKAVTEGVKGSLRCSVCSC